MDKRRAGDLESEVLVMLDDELGEERDGEIDLTLASTFIGATPLARSWTMTVSEPLVGKSTDGRMTRRPGRREVLLSGKAVDQVGRVLGNPNPERTL